MGGISERCISAESYADCYRPFLEWATNYSLFSDRNIVPAKLQKLPDAQQFGPNTSELAKDMGKMFNLSPMKLDNLIRGYGAGMATQTLNAADAITGHRT